MTGFTHLATGTLTAVLLNRYLHLPLEVSSAVILGSLLPDIDHTGSTIGKKMPFISFLISLFGHRGITHSLAFMLLFLFAGYYSYPFFYGLAIGIGVHIAGDALTPSGVPLLWPHKKRFKAIGIRTGTLTDRIIGVSAILVILLMAAGGKIV